MAGFKRRLRTQAERLAHGLGWRLSRLTPEERRYLRPSHADNAAELPPGAAEALQPQNPRLRELRERYGALDLPVTAPSLWTEGFLGADLDLRHFRGDNPYVWQYRRVKSQATLKYYLHLRYVEERDALGLLDRLDEDGAFGCWTFEYARRQRVSRDLLDSVNEINFLERQLGISRIPDLRVIDIGAGYGRLAHRLCDALANVEAYYCLDAIPESTFLCEYYLAHHHCAPATAVPLDELDTLPAEGAQLAVNIHSFSECTLEAVRWWIEWLAAHRVPNLLIVPNAPEALHSMEHDGSHRDFSAVLEENGYRLAHKEAVIDDPDVRRLTDISSHFFLFCREGTPA